MALIIDGYNLLHAAGILPEAGGPGNLERARGALLNFLAESLPLKERKRTVVVFDAGKNAPRGLSRVVMDREMTIRYAAEYEDADTLIEELISGDSSPRTLTVVSSDHRVQRAARRRKARHVDSDRWFGEILRERGQQNQPSPGADKPRLPLAAGEIEFWLDRFQTDPKQNNDQDIGNSPFPTGYGEDLLREDSSEEDG
jgi:predicted RNA-binding protein with PIN domain